MTQVPLGELFDPKAELEIGEHYRPHWSQAGAVTFITFRTCDSIPKQAVQLWERQKQEWLEARGYAGPWRETLLTLDSDTRNAFKKEFTRTREVFLDSCRGKCLLRQPELAQIVADSFLFFDEARYRMGDFIIMPNHVHLLASFPTLEAMQSQCDSWLHFTAFKINKAIGGHGKFWQQEPFDHLVRSNQQYDYLRSYIVDNPKKAGLKQGEYLYRRYET